MNQPPYRPQDIDRTIVRPMPGGRPVSLPIPAQADAPDGARPAGSPSGDGTPAPDLLPGLNPILSAAQPLLAMYTSIRTSASHPDPSRLRDDLAAGIRRFDARAGAAGVSPQHLLAARYARCTLLDEAAAGTPWGGSGVWASDTLLVRFHSETWGGEKVFQLLTRLAEQPQANRDLLELIYVGLACGFEGRYRVLDNGRSQLEALRERLYQMLVAMRAPDGAPLSVMWAPAAIAPRRWYELTPLWVLMAACAALAVGGFVSLSLLLNTRSDAVFSQIQAVRPAVAAPVVSAATAPTPPPAPAPVRLAGFLQPEIAAGQVAVRDEAGTSVVTLRGDAMFAPGSAQLEGGTLALLARIGQALATQPGKVLVSGHTDSQPIRSARFPSNFHLSQARAQAVAQLLGQAIGPDRIQAEGRADAEPVAGNATPAERARNRRVDITLFAGGARP